MKDSVCVYMAWAADHATSTTAELMTAATDMLNPYNKSATHPTSGTPYLIAGVGKIGG